MVSEWGDACHWVLQQSKCKIIRNGDTLKTRLYHLEKRWNCWLVRVLKPVIYFLVMVEGITTNRKSLESYSYKGYSVSWQKSFVENVLWSVDGYRFIGVSEINAIKETKEWRNRNSSHALRGAVYSDFNREKFNKKVSLALGTSDFMAIFEIIALREIDSVSI